MSAMTELGYCEEQTVRQLRTYLPRIESRNKGSAGDGWQDQFLKMISEGSGPQLDIIGAKESAASGMMQPQL